MEMIYVEKFTDKAALTANYIEFFDNNLSVTCVGYNDFHDIQPYEKNRVQKVYSLHFVLSGQGVFEIYGKRHKVGEQDMFLIPPNETVCYYPDRNDPWVYIWVDFVGDNAETLMKRLGFGAVISSDCHQRAMMDCYYPEAKQLLREHGFEEHYILTKQGFVPVPLD